MPSHMRDGTNEVRVHQLRDSKGNEYTLRFINATEIQLYCKRYYEGNFIYRVTTHMEKREELAGTAEPYYASMLHVIEDRLGKKITDRLLWRRILEHITEFVNAYLQDRPKILEDAHKWAIATDLFQLNQDLTRARRNALEYQMKVDEARAQIDALISKYPQAPEWYNYLDKRP